MCRCALSPVSASTITRVFALLAATTIAAKSLWNPAATTSTAARNLSNAMNICSGVWAWATMRISSSTARTFAMPARKIAWLSARISLSMLRVPHKLIRINHARHTFTIGARPRWISAHHSPLALNHHILLPARYIRRQRDLKFHRRPYLQRRVRAYIYSRRAQISRQSLRIAARRLAMQLDRQLQRKPFSGPCFFGHSPSSFVALSFFSCERCQYHQNTLLAANSTTFIAQGRLYHGCPLDKSLISN